jgi:hypothetical protein
MELRNKAERKEWAVNMQAKVQLSNKLQQEFGRAAGN